MFLNYYYLHTAAQAILEYIYKSSQSATALNYVFMHTFLIFGGSLVGVVAVAFLLVGDPGLLP